MTIKFVQARATTLLVGVSSTETIEIVLKDLVDIYGNELVLADFGTVLYLTIDPGSTSSEEIISATGFTVNTDGSVSLNAGIVRGLAAKSPYGATGTPRDHAAGVTVIVSNVVQLYDSLVSKTGNQSIDGVKTFNESPVVLTPLNGTDAVNKDYADGLTYAGAPNASAVTKGVTFLSTAPVYPTAPVAVGDNDPRVPTANENNALLGTSGTAPSASNKFVDAADVSDAAVSGKIVRATGIALPALSAENLTNLPVKFGGDGSDGALSANSGNTNIDCAGAKILVKNYSSISITGTGSITFVNPHAGGTIVVVKCSGGAVMTSSVAPMIDVSGCGAAGGAAVTRAGVYSDGGAGGDGTQFFIFKTKGGGGGVGATGTAGSGGAVPTSIAPVTFFDSSSKVLLKYGMQFWVGGGGGAGGSQSTSGSGATGAGGRGGGGIVVEIGGDINFPTAGGISVAGKVGGNPTDATYSGAGGGGAGGFCLILYKGAATSIAGTVTVSGGSGGTNGSSASADGGGGGATAYTAGSNGSTGSGTNTGAGANGVYLVTKDTEYM